MRDLTYVDVDKETRIGALKIYRDDPEWYITFITPEAIKCWEEYREEREIQGDTITPDFPFVTKKHLRFVLHAKAI